MSVGYALSIGAAYFIGAVGTKLFQRDPAPETIVVAVNIVMLTAIFAFWTWWLP